MLPIMSGILYRLDGFGKGDGFLPFWPFNKWTSGGVNYTRYAIGLFVAAWTWNWVYILTYGIASSIPYGEKHWWMKAGLISWFGIGFIWGIASLSLPMALWLGFITVVMKIFDTDHAVFEVLFGALCTLKFCF